MITAKQYGPWALIAGGSEGVAASFAHKLAGVGMSLVLVARRPEPLEKLSQEVRANNGVEVRTLSLDLKRSDMLDRIREVTDDIEVGLLIFNAGDLGSITGPFLDRALEDVLTVVRVTAIGQTTLAHHFGSRMATRGRGGIILVGSMSGSAGMPTQATYCVPPKPTARSSRKPCGASSGRAVLTCFHWCLASPTPRRGRAVGCRPLRQCRSLLATRSPNRLSTTSPMAAPCMFRRRSRRCFNLCVRHPGGSSLSG
jgi:NAD(P)-dependent dehydrogenase (short-subunit alcohol dehydrogenase family)